MAINSTSSKKQTHSGAEVKKTKAPVTNIATVDPKNPMPFEYGGKIFSYLDRNPYIPFLFPKDDYAQTLLESRLLSNTQNACVTTKRDFCAGRGFQYLNLGDGQENKFPEAVQTWFDTMNIDSESLMEINKQIFESHFTFGNTPIELVRGSTVGKKFLFIYVHNFLQHRLEKPDPVTDRSLNTIQSKLFLRKGLLSASDIKSSKLIPIYRPLRSDKNNWIKDGAVERTIIWYKNSMTGFDYYGIPSNVAALIYAILEYKGARYNLDNFDNNLVLGAILALTGNLSDAEAQKIGKRINNTYTGDGKRGRTIVVASEEGINASDYHTMDTSKDGSFVESDKSWASKIVLANNWDEVLAGMQAVNSLGKGAGFLSKIFEIKLKTVIRPAQSDLLQNVWKHIFKIAGEWLGKDFALDYKNIQIITEAPVGAMTEVDITPAVTVDEVRKYNGIPALADNKKGATLLGEIKGAQQNQNPGGDPKNV
jgi:hypothetical protein